MAGIAHTFVSGIADGGDATLVRPSNWNADHSITGVAATVVALTDAATVALNFALGNSFWVALGGNRTLGVPTNAVSGQSGVVYLYQDGTGTRTLAYTWGWTFAGGTAPTLSTAGGTTDALFYDVAKYASSVVTITIATPGVVSWTAHGLATGQRIQLTTTGALPTGLTAATSYYVVYVGDGSFSLATTLANAAAGTKITTSGSQSGTHTMTALTIAATLAKAFS